MCSAVINIIVVLPMTFMVIFDQAVVVPLAVKERSIAIVCVS